VSARWAQPSNEVLEHLANQRLGMRSIEGSYRDFALSGDEAYLRGARDGIAFLQQENQTLRGLMADNSDQLARLSDVTDGLRRIETSGDTIVRLHQTGGTAGALAAIQGRQGDSLLSEFRDVARELQNEEHQLLHARDAEAARRFREAKGALIWAAPRRC